MFTNLTLFEKGNIVENIKKKIQCKWYYTDVYVHSVKRIYFIQFYDFL